MDIVKPKKHRSILKRAAPWLMLLLIMLITGKYLWFIAQADFSVDGDDLIYAEVKQGSFSVSVRGTGVLVADQIQWLSANVDAQVGSIEAKPGRFVKKGDVIIILNNPQLIQQLEETQWELKAMKAESIAQRVIQESVLLDQESLVLDAELNHESSKLRLNAQTTLLGKSEGSIAQIDFEKTQLETIQLKKRWQNQIKRQIKMQENLKAQNSARSARLNKMRKTLERIQLQVDSLIVKASMDSTIQELPLELGQRVLMGSKLAKLAKKGSYIAELNIPEIQIWDISIGQQVVIDTRNSIVKGEVNRIDPVVVNGNVQVDVNLTGKLPSDLRPDMTVNGEITTTNIADTLYVERPLFAQSQSLTSTYKVDANQAFAERVKVEFGKGSINQIQIVSGLKAGDTIIVSDPSRWDTHKNILIK